MASTEIGTVIGSDGEEIGSLAGVVSDNGVTAGALGQLCFELATQRATRFIPTKMKLQILIDARRALLVYGHVTDVTSLLFLFFFFKFLRGNEALTFDEVLAGLILFIFLFYRYLRSFIYPCLTSFELDQALKDLDDVYPTSRNGVADAVAQEWNAIANDFLTLEIEASQIREKSFQGSPWKTYLGFHPQLMSDIVQCYSKYEELKSRILTAREKDRQIRLEAEQYRRQIATQPLSEAQAHTTAYENPFRSQHDQYPPRPYGTS